MDIAILLYKLYQECEDNLELEELFQEVEDFNNVYFNERAEELKVK